MDRFLARGDARLRYRDEGRGPALLLLHGWALALEMWDPQVAALAATHRIVRLDRRGFGESSGRPDPQADARDAAALLAHLGLERVTVLGMSQGARAALSLAADATERIAGLILDGASADARLGLTGLAEEIPLEQYRALLASRGIDAVRDALAALPLLRLQCADADARRLVDALLRRYHAADLSDTAPPAASPDTPFEHLRLPVLVLTGALDSAQRQRIADAFCAALPQAERATVPHAGHLANLDNPRDYNAILTDFLARRIAAPPDAEERP